MEARFAPGSTGAKAADLHFTDDALWSISDKALTRETGARGLRSIIENAVDINHDEQLSVQAMDAGRHARQPLIQIDRICFARGGVDVVVDSVGSTWADSVNCLRPGGRLVVFGGTGGGKVEMAVRPVTAGQVSVLGTTMGSARDFAGLLAAVEALAASLDSSDGGRSNAGAALPTSGEGGICERHDSASGAWCHRDGSGRGVCFHVDDRGSVRGCGAGRRIYRT